MKREGELKSAFTRELKCQLPHFITLCFSTAGAPDREIVGNSITTRWEMKHGTPDFLSLGNQELCCMRLATQGHCRYCIWQEKADGTHQETLIVHPRMVAGRIGWKFVIEDGCQGYSMEWLVNRVKDAHKCL